jgi:glycolate dehydrogenase FAD-binding subunit
LSVDAIAATLVRASRDKQRVTIEGAGTKRGWGSIAPAPEVAVSTADMNAVVDHRYGDLTATVQAGASLAAVNRELARHGQWIPLDPPSAAHATIGGIVATNDSGPRRHRFGAPRDLIIGVEMIRVDGTVARAGGIVVKNVAGYDLGRLMTGSFGTLAVIASATFKLYPIPAASRTVIVDFGSATALAERVSATVAALAATPVTPTAVEIESHPMRLLVRFESIAAAAEQQAIETAQLAESLGATTTIVAGADETALWAAHAERVWASSGAVLKVTFVPTDLGPTIAWLTESLHDNVDWTIVGRAAVGVILLRINADVGRQSRTIAGLRARWPVGRGSVVIVRGSDELKRAVDVWGPAGDALALMRAVKQQFDPEGLLNPGRGPFGL